MPRTFAGRVAEHYREFRRDVPDVVVDQLVALLALGPGDTAVIKGVLHAQGRIPTPDVRLPLTNASKSAVDDALAAFGAGAV